MVSEGELASILAQDESSRLEFKKSVQFVQRIGQTVCGFANSGGGLLVLGVERNDGKTAVHGIANKDEAYQQMAAVIPRLEPKPRIRYEEHVASGKLLIIVFVDALPASEVCFFEKKVYVRQGSVNVEIRNQELVSYLRARGIISFEENRSPARLEDLSKEKILKHVASRSGTGAKSDGIPLGTLLQSLGVANAVGEFYIKNAGVLAFAKDVNRFFSNAEIRIVKYKGRVASLQAREFDQRVSDTLPELLEKAFAMVLEKAGFSATIVNGKRVEAPMIPPEVLREALTNAVGHR
ncbi:Putative DNA-binding domain protein [uncultured archaeon]|nr:Putative DNA-binding domain protein [uncultured archaeon]